MIGCLNMNDCEQKCLGCFYRGYEIRHLYRIPFFRYSRRSSRAAHVVRKCQLLVIFQNSCFKIQIFGRISELKFHNKIWHSIKLNKWIIIIYIMGQGCVWVWGWSRWSDWGWSWTSHHSIWISLFQSSQLRHQIIITSL